MYEQYWLQVEAKHNNTQHVSDSLSVSPDLLHWWGSQPPNVQLKGHRTLYRAVFYSGCRLMTHQTSAHTSWPTVFLSFAPRQNSEETNAGCGTCVSLENLCLLRVNHQDQGVKWDSASESGAASWLKRLLTRRSSSRTSSACRVEIQANKY